MENEQKNQSVFLSWQRMDIDQRIGFRGAKYTDVNLWLAMIIGCALTGLFYAALATLIPQTWLAIQFYRPSSRGIPAIIAFFAAWAIAILFVKWRKLCLQRKALKIEIVPFSRDFVLSATTAPTVLKHIYQTVDNPAYFVLMNRIERSLANLSNIGRVADVIDMLQSQAQNDEDRMESSYTIVRGFIWCVPILGFIGTVWGLSYTMNHFGDVLNKEGIAGLQDNIMSVIVGLSTAFETTLQGLVAALSIQLALSGLKKKEEQFLDDCKEYCHANIVSRLRLIHLDDDAVPSEK